MNENIPVVNVGYHFFRFLILLGECEGIETGRETPSTLLKSTSNGLGLLLSVTLSYFGGRWAVLPYPIEDRVPFTRACCPRCSLGRG